MPFDTLTQAASILVVGYDMLKDSELRSAPAGRRLQGLALTGSAAAGDFAVEVKAGTELLARVYNSDTGFPNRDDIQPVGKVIPANVEVTAKVVDAAGTNPGTLIVYFDR